MSKDPEIAFGKNYADFGMRFFALHFAKMIDQMLYVMGEVNESKLPIVKNSADWFNLLNVFISPNPFFRRLPIKSPAALEFA